MDKKYPHNQAEGTDLDTELEDEETKELGEDGEKPKNLDIEEVGFDELEDLEESESDANEL